jgi:two-component system, OmpR family, phosphate regulon sensor histidine kinase PhoR
VTGLLAITGWAALWPIDDRATGAQDRSVTMHSQSAGNVGTDRPIWQAMLAGLPDSALMLDRGCRVLMANASAQDSLAARPGQHLSLVSRSPELQAAVDAALATGETRSAQIRMLVPVERRLMGIAVPLQPTYAEDPALLLILRDLTEQDQLTRMRADFVTNASHELRTPLASLKGFVETLQGAAKNDPDARVKFLAIMQEQADRMSRLIEDLLSLSRIEMREHVPPRDRVDVVDIVQEVARGSRLLAESAGIQIILHEAEHAPGALVLGDRDELVQLAHNLVQNAIKYGKLGGRVEVGVRTEGPRLALVVADDGIGIAPEHLPRLTERFYRVSAKASRERGGTGLGLAIVKHIVNRHQGELRIDSNLGEGSTFTVLLPRQIA